MQVMRSSATVGDTNAEALTYLALTVVCALLYLPALIAAGTRMTDALFYRDHAHLTRMVFTLVATPAALLAIGTGTLLFMRESVFDPWLILKLSAVAGMASPMASLSSCMVAAVPKNAQLPAEGQALAQEAYAFYDRNNVIAPKRQALQILVRAADADRVADRKPARDRRGRGRREVAAVQELTQRIRAGSRVGLEGQAGPWQLPHLEFE
mgnify:CR=1 FL=1